MHKALTFILQLGPSFPCSREGLLLTLEHQEGGLQFLLTVLQETAHESIWVTDQGAPQSIL